MRLPKVLSDHAALQRRSPIHIWGWSEPGSKVAVQFSSYNSHQELAPVRDGQRCALAEANTAMVVSLDVGEAENIHPADKQTVANRLVLAAKSIAYGKQVVYQGPQPRRVTRQASCPLNACMRV